ncbi:MAG TPA: hypothetical protein ENJ21_02555 [Chromatiaceae bacterium]|nr:hypothetical protein [Chromatiaceae bacterium]
MAIALIAGAMLAGLVNRLTHIPSTALARLWCGERYMRAVDGIVGDVSCGFDADMFFVVALMGVILLGVLLLIASQNR